MCQYCFYYLTLNSQIMSIVGINDQRNLMIHLQRQALKVSSENSNLLKKLKHLNHALEITDQKIKLKIEQLVTKKQLIDKRKKDILKITQASNAFNELFAKYEQKYQRMEKQVQSVSKSIDKDRREIQQEKGAIQRLQMSIQNIHDQYTHSVQELQINYSKADKLQRHKQIKTKSQRKIEFFLFQIQEFQSGKSQAQKARLSNALKKIEEISNQVKKRYRNNALLKERLREMKLLQSKSLHIGSNKNGKLKKDQKQQIKDLQLQIGRLNQQLVFANEKTMDLKSAIMEKAQINKKIEGNIGQLTSGNIEGISLESSSNIQQFQLNDKSGHFIQKTNSRLSSFPIRHPPNQSQQPSLSANNFQASLKISKSLKKTKNAQSNLTKYNNCSVTDKLTLNMKEKYKNQQQSIRQQRDNKIQYRYHVIQSQDQQQKQENITTQIKKYKERERINTRIFDQDEKKKQLSLFEDNKQCEKLYQYANNLRCQVIDSQNKKRWGNSMLKQQQKDNNQKNQGKQNSKGGGQKGWRQNGDLKRLIERYQFIRKNSKVGS